LDTLRFVYLTDTHLGCQSSGYQLQTRYPGQEDQLFTRLADWLKEQEVTFVVHGGDLTDHGSREEIDHAGELCERLGVPVYLCLGNHDLAQVDSIGMWRTAKGGLLPDGRECFAVEAGPARLVIVGHHWHPHVDFHWQDNEPQAPRIDHQQEYLLDTLLETSRPVIAVTHAPLNAVTAEQCGGDEPFHPPHAPYLATWRRLAERHPNLLLALCGHNHAHSQHDHGPFVSCTTAAFGEAPAQLRLVTLTSQKIEVRTLALASVFGLREDLQAERTWCIGPSMDHSFSIAL